jgi:hypothetical protein
MFFQVLVVAALTAQQPSPPIGQRTIPPERLLSALQLGPDAGGEEAAVAAAAAFPLGSAQNPVRVGGPEGERAYLARLRCGNGAAPAIGQRTDGGVGAFGSVVNAYTVDCGAAAPGRTILSIDIYHEEHREDRAPAGLTILGR